MKKLKKFVSTAAVIAAMAITGNASASATMIPIGECKLTFYCPCSSCSDGYGRKTSTGTIAEQGRTIAVDPRVIPYGTTVYIDGWGLYKAEDCGGGVKGNHIDIYRDSHTITNRLGVKRAKAYIVK